MEKIAKNLQLLLMCIILVSTVIAVGIEIYKMFENRSVTLADLLLMFLYLEVLAMVRVFWNQQSISITLPLLIAITALARFIILISTVIAVGIEIYKMFQNRSVTLADLLLMFLYLEVLAMVRVFWNQQSISITLPLLIAITALARFIILQGKEMDPSALVYEAVAIVLIAGAIVILRLRHSDKLGLKSKKKS